VLLAVASFVPRPVLRDETVEDQQNVIEEMVDEKVECNEDDEMEELGEEEITLAEPGSSYTVHPSGRLTLVFKNSPQHSCSPAHSPALPCTDAKPPANAIRDVRVKLERCDSFDDTGATPSKRSRLKDDGPASLPASPRDDPLQRLKSETKDEDALSEANTAVAGLLGCSTCGTDYVSDMTTEPAASFGQLHDGLDVYSLDDDPLQYGAFSATEADLERNTKCSNENGIDMDDTTECDPIPDCGIFKQTEASDGEIMTAVGNLMADLSQLNAVTSGTVRTVIPNGSVYLPSSPAKISLNKWTLDANSRSLDSSSLSGEVAPAVESIPGIQQPNHQNNTAHGSPSFSFCNRAKYASSDHESDLDAAIKSILS